MGSAFTVYLPRVKEEIEATGPSVTHEGSTVGNETILIVEDQDPVRKLMTRILTAKGYTVLQARNGQEALEKTEQQEGPIHMVVTDVVMPEMGGREFVARVKTVCPYAKVLYVSGYPFDSLAEEGSINPAAPFLRKPFNPTELTSMVRQELDAAASER